MDSRLLYTIAINKLSKVSWLNSSNSDSEWIYIGTNHEVDKEAISKRLLERFEEENFYIILGRDNSKEIEFDDINEQIIQRIGSEDFKLCNKSFSIFIEFNKVGIMRVGTVEK